MCLRDTSPATAVGYLIMVRDHVVACDLAETVAEFAPTAVISVEYDLQGAEAAAASVDRMAVAFLEAAPHHFAGSSLAQAIAARGGHVVLLGEAAEANGADGGYSVLHRPFSSTLVQRHLEAAAARGDVIAGTD